MSHQFDKAFFLRSPFHAENMVQTILCMVSRLRAAFADLRFTLSCKRLTTQSRVAIGAPTFRRP